MFFHTPPTFSDSPRQHRNSPLTWRWTTMESTQSEAGKCVWILVKRKWQEPQIFGGWILRIEWYTPININILNLKITQLTEKNHRPNLHFWKPCYLFRVYWVSTDSFAPRPFQSDQLQSTSTFMDAQQGKLFSADNVMDWSYQMMLQKWLWLFRSVFQALMKLMDKECTIIYHLIWVVPLRERVANEGL